MATAVYLLSNYPNARPLGDVAWSHIQSAVTRTEASATGEFDGTS